ncbi:MAG TPA: hypothetical protein VFA10_14520 [Ktedonobacteraceae bacterium]|nr:hypothetical protein [Ktedonobacteraceae bacterium]
MKVNEMEAKEVIVSQGWTPRILPRRNGRRYIYAARRENKKVLWRYIGPCSKLGEMTKESIIAQINKTKTA